jgi:hypothetical protein
MTTKSKKTTDHETIRKWAEKRGGLPATVRGTAEKRHECAGLLRIDFPQGRASRDSLKPISWDEFFDKFDEKNLVFLYQEKTATGKPSRFCKFVSPDSARGGSARR